MKITVLGCGSSMGTPAAGGFWGRCDPAEPRNERSRASILVAGDGTVLLVDATYDLRLQLNRHRVQHIDGVLLTHSHSDHIAGIDDLRSLAYRGEMKIDVYTDQETMDELARRRPYLFAPTHEEVYVPFLEQKVIPAAGRFTAGGIGVESFVQDHMTCHSLGFRFGDFAYCVDVANLDDKALAALKGVETWIVDGGGYHRKEPTTHANIRRVMEWADILKPKMTYITVLSTHMDYKTLCDELPPHIRPAWDGMEIVMGTNRL